MKPESVTPETATTTPPPDPHATLKTQLGAHLQELEESVARRQQQDSAKVATMRENLRPALEEAARIKAEFTTLLDEFGPLLDRLIALNMAQVRGLTGRNVLGEIQEDARSLKAEVRAAITQLGNLPGAVEALTPEGLHLFNPSNITQVVESFRYGPQRVVDKMKDFRDRLSQFEAARNR